MKPIMIVVAIAALTLGLAACAKSPTDPARNTMLQNSMNGAMGQMTAFYDSVMFTVNMKQLSDQAGASVGANKSHNNIFASNDLDEEQDFMPVLDAIQADGFNPLWEQMLIVFNPGFAPHQFYRDDAVLAAAAGPNPEIHLVDTHEVYRCSVVGPGPKKPD